MSAACDDCLRRGYLIGRLAARISGLLDRPARRPAGLLALPDRDFVAAVAGEETAQAMSYLDTFDAQRARAELRVSGVEAVCRHGAGYPRPLAGLTDAPAALFFVGGVAALDVSGSPPAVAIVGSRRPSPYGLEMAYELGRGLGAAGLTVVSGLALGIDAAAHRGCLDGGGTPVAVLAGGPDIPYPRTNGGLYARVREQGAVVSELPPGRRAYRWSFPARNRIMAGLAQMTVVVEAAEPSGSLITSEFATDLQRAVGAVPGQATSAVASGTNRLLRDGASVVTGPQDVLDELCGAGVLTVPGPRARGGPPSPPDPPDPLRRSLLEAVEAGLGIDAICAHAGLPAGEARAALARLEASGHVRRDALGLYRRTAVAR